MGKKLATNFFAFGIKMTPSAVLVLMDYLRESYKSGAGYR